MLRETKVIRLVRYGLIACSLLSLLGTVLYFAYSKSFNSTSITLSLQTLMFGLLVMVFPSPTSRS